MGSTPTRGTAPRVLRAEIGYGAGMSENTHENDMESRLSEGRTSRGEQRAHHDRDLDLGGTPSEEGIDAAQAHDQLDDDPEDEPNFTDDTEHTDKD